MFVVVRKGVYDQGVVAIEDNIGDAFDKAEHFAKKESDVYHSFEIRVKGGEVHSSHGGDCDGEPSEGYDRTLYTFGTWDHRTRKSTGDRIWRNMRDEMAVWDNG